jgi:hypothetical protein
MERTDEGYERAKKQAKHMGRQPDLRKTRNRTHKERSVNDIVGLTEVPLAKI